MGGISVVPSAELNCMDHLPFELPGLFPGSEMLGLGLRVRCEERDE